MFYYLQNILIIFLIMNNVIIYEISTSSCEKFKQFFQQSILYFLEINLFLSNFYIF